MQKEKQQRYFTAGNVKYIDYKDVDVLGEFIDPHARILPKRKTRVSARNQRLITQAIKRARYMALLPYVEQ